MTWGPADQAQPDWQRTWLRRASLLVLLALLCLPAWVAYSLIAVRVALALRRIGHVLERARSVQGVPAPTEIVDRPERMRALLTDLARLGAGVFLGTDVRDGATSSRAERAVLLLGLPRSGKTSGVIIPAVLRHNGPVVSTSTKGDVMAATVAARSLLGDAWVFDPTGTNSVSVARQLRWSPILGSRHWDGAVLMARAMVTGAGVGIGTTDQSHWAKRAQALLAPLLHAASADGRSIADVVGWVMRHELDEPGMVLERERASLVASVVVGLQNTEARERSSIFSATADALEAYTSQAALKVAESPNFFPSRFVVSHDTVYIHAPAEHQAAVAPLICGLLAEIRRETYDAHRTKELRALVLFALDEVANIAPLSELPQIASEGGGQGLALLAALQDLSQAWARWGAAADGFLTLFGAKLVLPGIADAKTLEAVSLALGEYDRRVVSTTRGRSPGSWGTQRSETVSTQRQRVLSPGEIANIPAGHGLYLDGVDWQLLALVRAYREEPWRTLTQLHGAPPASRKGVS